MPCRQIGMKACKKSEKNGFFIGSKQDLMLSLYEDNVNNFLSRETPGFPVFFQGQEKSFG